jgi:type VI secretion system protein ImpL
MHPATPPAPTINLTKLYDGQEGFVQLVADFANGNHVFGIDDFRESYSPAQWSELRGRLSASKFRSARVFLRVELSDQMKLFLGARTARADVPNVILE